VTAGEKKTLQITLVNNSSDTVEIEHIESSCDCFRVDLGRNVISPGEEINATLTLDLVREPDFVGAMRLEVTGFTKTGATAFVIHVDTNVVAR
jgi:hypothetical protein